MWKKVAWAETNSRFALDGGLTREIESNFRKKFAWIGTNSRFELDGELARETESDFGKIHGWHVEPLETSIFRFFPSHDRRRL